MLTLNTTGYELYIPDAETADGCFITDSRGKRYADMESGVWALPLGHNHSRVQKAMLDQAAKLSHTGYRYTSPVVEQASEALLEISGHGDGKCIFLSSGSEAVELALRISKITAEKPLMLRLDKHYLAAYGLTNDERSWVTLDTRAGDGAPASDIPFEKIGVFVLEPGNASGTVSLPPASLIKDIAEKVRSNGGWVVADEVTTGMGRTGKWFGFEHYSVKPDIVACGKGLGNGYPVSAVTISRRIYEKLLPSGFAYAQSHQNDPLGCAVAKAVIDTIRDEGLIERSAALGRILKEMLTALSNKYSCIKEVRGVGLMCAVEFRSEINEARLTDLHKKLFEAGFIAGLKSSARVLRFYPPLIIPEELIESLAYALDKILCAL